MLEFATAGPSGLAIRGVTDEAEYWKELRQSLKATEPKRLSAVKRRENRDMQLVHTYSKRVQTINQLRDALMVAVADDSEIARIKGESPLSGAGQNVANIMEVSIALGVANEVRGYSPYSTNADDESRHVRHRYVTTPLYDRNGGLIHDSIDLRYDPAVMVENEDDERYFHRLRIQSRPEEDSQLVLDVAGWVVARPTVEGTALAIHPVTEEAVRIPDGDVVVDPITNKAVKLPPRKHIIWPTAIRFMSVEHETDDVVFLDVWEKKFKLGMDMVPCREPKSGLPVHGEADGYKMPDPILDNSRIVTETNAKLRRLLNTIDKTTGKPMVTRQKRNFDLQQEILKGIAKKRIEEDRASIEAVVDQYRIPQREVEQNVVEMLLDLEARRRARLAAYWASKRPVK
jgi:hypothetical protein